MAWREGAHIGKVTPRVPSFWLYCFLVFRRRKDFDFKSNKIFEKGIYIFLFQMVFFCYFLSSPCIWIKFMIIEKCQCLYNGNFAFGNVLNIHVKVIAFWQSELLWLLRCSSIFDLVSKDKNKQKGFQDERKHLTSTVMLLKSPLFFFKKILHMLLQAMFSHYNEPQFNGILTTSPFNHYSPITMKKFR